MIDRDELMALVKEHPNSSITELSIIWDSNYESYSPEDRSRIRTSFTKKLNSLWRQKYVEPVGSSPKRWREFEGNIKPRKAKEKMHIEYNGVSKPLCDWCNELGMRYKVVRTRIVDYGWSVEDALETPVGSKRAKA